jgi:hypothetical protein
MAGAIGITAAAIGTMGAVTAIMTGATVAIAAIVAN